MDIRYWCEEEEEKKKRNSEKICFLYSYEKLNKSVSEDLVVYQNNFLQPHLRACMYMQVGPLCVIVHPPHRMYKYLGLLFMERLKGMLLRRQRPGMQGVLWIIMDSVFRCSKTEPWQIKTRGQRAPKMAIFIVRPGTFIILDRGPLTQTVIVGETYFKSL